MKRTMSRYTAILAATMIATVTACSYVVDVVERSITKRASFSITATYDPGTKNVTITWTESAGGNFAGFEVYVTTEPDDEYSDYAVAAAGYTISSNAFFETAPSLLDSGTRSYTFSAQEIYDDGASPNTVINYVMGPGRYFFRLGIINWDEDPDERTYENGYTEPWDLNKAVNYPANTDISEISGLAAVDIY